MVSSRRPGGTPMRPPSRSSLAVLVLSLTVSASGWSCGPSAPAAPRETGAALRSARRDEARRLPRDVRPIDPATTGSLLVRVRFDGTPPPRRELDVSREPGCLHDEAPLSDALVVDADGGLANAVVEIVRGHEGWEAPDPGDEPTTLTQRGCVFRPHVVALRAGTPLVITNEDELSHNVNLKATRNRSRNAVQAAGGSTTITLDRIERSIPVQCDLHPWMGAWIHVIGHPWFATTDAAGVARIDGLPEGDYEIDVRHETLGGRRVSATVRANAQGEVEVAFEP